MRLATTELPATKPVRLHVLNNDLLVASRFCNSVAEDIGIFDSEAESIDPEPSTDKTATEVVMPRAEN